MGLPNPGPIALKALDDAKANIGATEEGENNWGPYVKQYLADVGIDAPAPWCAAFVHYRLKQAMVETKTEVDDIPHTGYVPDWVNWAKNEGLWIPVYPSPECLPGDLVCYYFEAKGECHHIGFLTVVNGPLIQTVEGNTRSPGGSTFDGVWRRTIGIAKLGEFGGFIRLPF